MKKVLLLSLLLTVVSLSSCFGCGYCYQSYCELINRNVTNSDYPFDLVAYGEILEVDDTQAVLKVHTRYIGNSNDTIVIWADSDYVFAPNTSCEEWKNMSTTQLGTVGETIFVELRTIDSLENPWDVIGDYRVPFYNDPYRPRLRVENGVVKGPIANYGGWCGPPYDIEIDSMPVWEFNLLWKGGGNMSCDHLNAIDELQLLKFEFKESPGKIRIASPDNKEYSLMMYGINGQLLEKISFQGQTDFDTSTLQNTLYSILITDNRNRFWRRTFLVVD